MEFHPLLCEAEKGARGDEYMPGITFSDPLLVPPATTGKIQLTLNLLCFSPVCPLMQTWLTDSLKHKRLNCFSPLPVGAERGGFEPPVPRYRDNGFRDRPIRPLWHLSVCLYNISSIFIRPRRLPR